MIRSAATSKVGFRMARWLPYWVDRARVEYVKIKSYSVNSSHNYCFYKQILFMSSNGNRLQRYEDIFKPNNGGQ